VGGGARVRRTADLALSKAPWSAKSAAKPTTKPIITLAK
jgi:hypothetical protein